jgi:hypothetical protein
MLAERAGGPVPPARVEYGYGSDTAITADGAGISATGLIVIDSVEKPTENSPRSYLILSSFSTLPSRT